MRVNAGKIKLRPSEFPALLMEEVNQQLYCYMDFEFNTYLVDVQPLRMRALGILIGISGNVICGEKRICFSSPPGTLSTSLYRGDDLLVRHEYQGVLP